MTVPSEPTVETFGKDESVVQCLAIMGEIAEEQRGRNRHLDTKGLSRLAGGEGREVGLLEGDEAAGELE
jgi:hypothetical protein